MNDEKGYNKKTVIKLAGAFIAWVIGSGFATGQEVLQFITSYGYLSYVIVLINLAGFLIMGRTLLVTGFKHKNVEGFNHFTFFCGKKLGTFYTFMVSLTLILVMPVLISGAGATLHEYYGVNSYVGSAIMVTMVLIAYLVGFEKLVKIVSTIGPVIIIFSLLVGTITLFRDFDNITTVNQYDEVLSASNATPNWLISAVLYISLNFICGSVYYTQLGISATSEKEARHGATLGAVALILSIAIMNTAMLLNAGDTATLAIPVLFLAKKISYALGAVFSIVLILGMFSSCSAMMWTICSKFEKYGKKKNRIIAVGVAILSFCIGLLPFSGLISTFYPLMGYMGIIFMGCVIYKAVRREKYSDTENIEDAKDRQDDNNIEKNIGEN